MAGLSISSLMIIMYSTSELHDILADGSEEFQVHINDLQDP